MIILRNILKQKRFYKRETIRGIRISRLAIIPPLYHDYLIFENNELKKGFILVPSKGSGLRYEGHFLNYTMSNNMNYLSVCIFFSSVILS